MEIRLPTFKRASILLLLCLSLLATSVPLISKAEVSQYEWPMLGHDSSWTEFSDGPAPSKPNVLWKTDILGSGVHFASSVVTHKGRIFTQIGPPWFTPQPSKLACFNATTGAKLWEANITHGTGGSTQVILDDQHIMIVTLQMVGGVGGLACYRISDGVEVWYKEIGIMGHPGAEVKQYLEGRYSQELKLYFTSMFDLPTQTPYIVAYNLSNPSSPPTLAWQKVVHEHGEVLACGGGKVFFGSYHGYVYAFDGKTGELVWKAPKIGEIVAYSATYVDGRLIHGSGTTRLTCYNATDGTVLWDYDAGPRAFFAFCGAAAYGRYYQHNIDPWGGFVGCWDIETGKLLWKAPAHYFIGYVNPVVADGKVYITTSDGSLVAGEEEAPPVSFTCLDAFTGAKLWEVNLYAPLPAIAYGNLYVMASTAYMGSNALYCISDQKKPSDWIYFRGNINQPGVAVNQMGPSTLNLKWAFQTEGTVMSSPAVVNGKVYIGSHDQHIYCIDAYTGSLVWKFKTNYRVTSSPAVVGGKVYTGFDDGRVYCLNASNGNLIWQTQKIYSGDPPPILIEVCSWQPRSSPIVVGNRLYVGALDGNVYCMDTANGNILQTYQTNGPIVGSPAYANGRIYIASTDKKLYCLDANTLKHIWNWTTPKQPWMVPSLFFGGTPTVADGKVFIGGGAAYSVGIFGSNIILVALNATDGTLIWRKDMIGQGGLMGTNTQSVWTPTYVNGVLYVGDGMGVAAYNATDGERIWYQWLGFQVFSSVAYADDPLGPKIYVGCDSYSVTALDPTTGKVLSLYTTKGQVVSSPAIYDGMVIVGSADHNVYCFSDKPTYTPTIVAWCDWQEAYLNDTIIVHSRLLPGLPNEKLILTLTKPGGAQVHINETTDEKGWADFSFQVDQAGDWTWTVWYEGKDKDYIVYTYAYTDTYPLTVKTAITGPTAPPAIPTEYIIAAIVIIAVIIVVAAYTLKKKTKK
ncbi:MAG: PQQ-binding-like beta-propeller repeat protein [Candidatus Bathyarchaeia archaeon]